MKFTSLNSVTRLHVVNSSCEILLLQDQVVKPTVIMITKVATLVYCILAATYIFQGESFTINSKCGKVQKGNDDDCLRMGAAHWFVVLDASGNRSDDNLYDEKQLVNKMIEKLLELRNDIKSAYKFRFSVTLATDRIYVKRELCDEESKTPPVWSHDMGYSSISLMDDVLDMVQGQVDACSPNSTTQRIVLYITHSRPNDEAMKIINQWDTDYERGIRSTQVHFFVIATKIKGIRQKHPFRRFGKMFVPDVPSSLRSLLHLDPDSSEFKDARDILGGHAVQCACRLSEDCGRKNATVLKPCHFNIVGRKEQCTTMISEIVYSWPKYPRYPNTILSSCNETKPPINFTCNRMECVNDCDKMVWSQWSTTCDQYGNKNRFRLNNSESHSQFTESCQPSESDPCRLAPATTTTTAKTTTTTTTTSTAITRTTTEDIQLTVQTGTWALIFALLILSGSIIGAVVVFACVRRRKRRQSRLPHHKGGDRQRFESGSAASTATESRAASKRDASMSRGPSSTWGRGSVSFTNVDDPQRPKQRQKPASSKIKKDDRRKSTSQPAKKSNKNASSSYRPRSASVHVSLNEQQRPSDKKSKSSKVTNSQKKKKIG